MTTTSVQPYPPLRYKSAAGALLLSVMLGPVGLLYASFWGGCTMIVLSIAMFSSKFFFVSFLLWLICCIWSVGAVESYNRKLAILYTSSLHSR